MREFIWIFALMIACGSSTRTSTTNDGGVIQLDDGGVIRQGECVNNVQTSPLETRLHILLDQQPRFQSNPPVSGEHYPFWARWGVHTEIVPRGYWVHNLEHGGVVFLYRPDAPRNLVDALVRVFNRIPANPPCNHGRIVVTGDPMLDVPWAVTVSGPEDTRPEAPSLGVGYVIKADCIKDEQALVDFAVAHRNMGAETLCDDGSYPF